MVGLCGYKEREARVKRGRQSFFPEIRLEWE